MCATAMALGIAFVGSAGCITKPDCVYTAKIGHPWRATVIGTATKHGEPWYAKGLGEACMTDAEDAILEAADLEDPEYVVLRSQLLVEALADCTDKALEDGLKNIHCDPFDTEFDGIVQIARLEGPCLLTLADGLEGTPLKQYAHCPDKPAEEAGNESSTGEPAADSDTASLLPTTSAGPDDEALAATITCDRHTCRVSRHLVETVLANPAALLRGAELLPLTHQGQLVGVLFSDIAPGSLADRLGFTSGELIVAIDDRPFTTLDELLLAAGAALDAESLTVTTRRGAHTVDHRFIRD